MKGTIGNCRMENLNWTELFNHQPTHQKMFDTDRNPKYIFIYPVQHFIYQDSSLHTLHSPQAVSHAANCIMYRCTDSQ